MKRASAYANANIALVKYWGKNDSPLNIPAVSSLSMTLNDFGTKVTVTSSNAAVHAAFVHGQAVSPDALLRLGAFLEQVRELYPFDGYLEISSESTVPVAAGLASSASFFAALALALNDFFTLNLSQQDLSRLARIGSGSAARSIFPGYAGLYGGPNLGHEEAHGFPIEPHPALKLAMVVAVVNQEQKAISSREAMNLTKNTSPFYKAFVLAQNHDFEQAIFAIKSGSFTELGTIMEHSTLKMFATMWATKPAINYWQPNTLALINLVYQLRKEHGPKAFFTMDAGPNVKILCPEDFMTTVITQIEKTSLARRMLSLKPGLGAHSLQAIS